MTATIFGSTARRLNQFLRENATRELPGITRNGAFSEKDLFPFVRFH
jgi:hypothetical protein